MANETQPQMQEWADNANAGIFSHLTAGFVAVFLSILLILTTNLLWTTRDYHARIRDSEGSVKEKAGHVPLIPYAIPVLGSTLSFSTQKVGVYWRWLS